MQDSDRPNVNNHYREKGISIIIGNKASKIYQKFLTEKGVTVKVNPAGQHKLSTLWPIKEKNPFTFRILKLEHAITIFFGSLTIEIYQLLLLHNYWNFVWYVSVVFETYPAVQMPVLSIWENRSIQTRSTSSDRRTYDWHCQVQILLAYCNSLAERKGDLVARWLTVINSLCK